MNKEALLALDTSNYTTSLAVIDINRNILLDERMVLNVKQGERGLRQSHALFQHLENLPQMLTSAFDNFKDIYFKAIAVSDKPRPIENSYMPVFLAGRSFGQALAASLSAEFYTFSHQEGHLSAASHSTDIDTKSSYLAFHLSGGTCELLVVDKSIIKAIGRSLDISYGQVIDRIGVRIGLSFPCGRELDQMAMRENNCSIQVKPVHFKGLDINLSGLETQLDRLIKESDDEALIYSLFSAISDSLIKWTSKAIEATGIRQVLFTGGVSASQFIRRRLLPYFKEKDITIAFGQASLSTDNAVGIALLGGEKLWG